MDRRRRRVRPRRRTNFRRFLYPLIPIVLAVIYLSGSAGFVNQYRLVQKKRQLEQRERELEARKAELQAEIDRLRHDRAYLEKVAREVYGLCRPDEVVFMMKLQDEDF
ncbi:MAG: septum formation initiator family protein [bacterium]|nr:septum formation initiator family protein [candidate division KSB1 bacterium]MDH7559020.1 septum formation initiator family protein [bacterium]